MSKWHRVTPKELKQAVKKPRGIYWVEQEGNAFYWWTLDPQGKPCKCRGRYKSDFRAGQGAESFGFVRGEKP